LNGEPVKYELDKETGDDSKILAVPIDGVSKFHENVRSHQEVQPALLELITHFFEHYKDLEPNKWVTVYGWEGATEAQQEIADSIQRYDDLPEKPLF
jgi:inorganic pyrophosphatase